MEDNNGKHGLISVIIPVYNSVKWLRRCVDSVLNQTCGNLEILLIDDGSTDDSARICDEYGLQDERVVVIHQQNRGVSEARNTGLRHASGEYISFIDNDDWIHPRFFEMLLRALIETGSDVSMCYYRNVWNDEFAPDTNPVTSDEPYRIVGRREMIGALLAVPIDTYRSSPVPYELIWGKLYRREILKDLYYRDVWGEDAEYNSRLYLRVESIVLVPQYLYSWIQNPRSLHRNQSPEGFDGYLKGNLAILENIPPACGYERSLALKRVMLCLLASRYNITNFKYFEKSKEAVSRLMKERAGDIVKEFRSNRHISFGFKAGIVVFYYLPFTYNLFRWVVAKCPKLLG